MKTRSLTNLGLVLTLSALPFVGGCTQSNATNAASTLTNVPPAAVTSAGGNSAVTALTENTNSAPPVPRAEPALPPNILPATPLADVIRLAQSGVGENVLLTFVTNSIQPFDLDSEEIVYLNDIGVSDGVITMMMQHDQGLKVSASNLAPAPAPKPEPVLEPAPEPIAAAPSYVNAPPAAPVAEVQPTHVSNNYFNDSLAPYGNWIEIEGYGRCWQPTVVVVNRNWQPYGDRGRWIYTDAGWYWLSDYSWGATTFHYGRWFTHPSWGWCWWPDTVWAPSWVSWRFNSAFCGWAPLPPMACFRPGFGFSWNGGSVGIGFGFGIAASCYTFVPWGGFCAVRPCQFRLPAHQATQVFNNTTVINNYGNGNNNIVINGGISPDRVREYTRTEVRTVNLREQTTSGPRNERLARDGRTLAVHRPQFAPVNGGGEVRGGDPGRNVSPKANGSTVSGVPVAAARSSVARTGRSEIGVVGAERSRVNGNPGDGRVVPSTPEGIAPTTVTKSPATSPARVEARPNREPQPQVAGGVSNPGRVSSPAPVRTGVVSAPPASAPAATLKVNQPRVVQAYPQNTARPTAAPVGSLVVIGGRSAAQPSGGRDYSVWNTPRPAPTASVPERSTRTGTASRSAPPSSVSSSPVTENKSAPVSRGQTERAVPSRGSYSTYSTPSPRPAPSVPSGASRSEASRPAPSYVPQPASPSPAASGQRFESRSAPAPVSPTAAPARPPSGPVSSPGPRSR